MKILRFVALLVGVVLLVTTAVSVVHRRGDVRDAQSARLENTARLVDNSVRATVLRLRLEVELTASTIAALEPDERTDLPVLADRLAESLDGADACVGFTATGCSGADLFAVDAIDAVAQRTMEPDVDRTIAAVDSASDSIIVVRRILIVGADEAAPAGNVTVAVRISADRLRSSAVSPPPGADADADEADVAIALRRRGGPDEFSDPAVDGDRRIVRTVIATPFEDGAVTVISSVDRSIGVAGDATALYLFLFILGAVLLAMAAWTLLVERRKLERRATTDELTDLINRREFERISEEALDAAARGSLGLCVMVLDLNGFKQINDTLGHQFGDLVLTAAAERFVDAVRETDVVGRWGGDEFVILLPGLSERSAVRDSAERIWDRLASEPVVGDTSISASIGAAIYPRHGVSLDALMRAADVAMYEAKTTGVGHRIADTIAVSESMLDRDPPGPQRQAAEPDPAAVVVTDGYEGPDRRRSPVPPPPMPPSSRSSSPPPSSAASVVSPSSSPSSPPHGSTGSGADVRRSVESG